MPRLEEFDDIDDWIESEDDDSFDSIDVDGVSEAVGQIFTAPAAAIGKLLSGGGGAPRQPLRRVTVPTAAGVSTATLTTPQGAATLRLPEPVVTRTEFESGLRRLENGINADSARINTVSKDLEALRTRVGAVVTENQRDIGRLRATLTQQQKTTLAALRRIRQDQQQQNMMSMVVSMMIQGQLQDQFASHTHQLEGATAVLPPKKWPAETNAPASTSSNSSAAMLPMMMMMGQGDRTGQSDSGSMMAMAFALIAMNQS